MSDSTNYGQAGLARSLPRALEQEAGAVDSCDPHSPLGQRDRVAAWTAAEIQHGQVRPLGHSRKTGDLVDLLLAQAEPLLREHERVELAPERVVLEPLAHCHVPKGRRENAGSRTNSLTAAAP
jgi:hypothetical protein